MFEDRVKRGAELLDRVRPGWAREIATYDINMGACDECILGRLFGRYEHGLGDVLSSAGTLEEAYNLAPDFGFNVPVEYWGQGWDPESGDLVCEVVYRRLADAWRAAIRRRLDEGDPDGNAR